MRTDSSTQADLLTAGGKRSGRPLRLFWAFVGWCALLPVVIVLALRWQALESPLTIAIAGLTPFVGLPLLVAILGAWLGRARSLRAAAAIALAGYLLTTSPVDAVIGCRGAATDDGITIYTANVLFGSGRPDEVAESIVAADADVVVMQEAQWPFLQPLREDERLAEYRYRSDARSEAKTGTIIWSRLPMIGLDIEPFVDRGLIHATIEGPSGPFTVTGVHTLAPIRSRFVGTWHRQFELLAAIDTATPRVAAGDFNATSDHQQFRALLDAGWTDVHDKKGCGFDATWPVDGSLPLAVMRLDHILVSDHFEVVDLQFGDPAGSDHKPVVATIRLTGGTVGG